MQSVRTCYYLHILTFVKVVLVYYNVKYVILSTIPENSIIFCYIVCIDKIINKYFRLRYMYLKGHLLTITKL